MLRFPTRALALALPLALTLTACDSSTDDADVDAGVYATSNVATAGDDSVVRLSSALAAEATFGGLVGSVLNGTSIQSVALRDGDGYITVDLAGGVGGIVVVEDLCADDGSTNAGTSIGTGARVIAGFGTGLVAPKGIINGDDQIFVADNGSNSVRVYPETATGNAAPTYVITNLGAGTNVWDVAYDDGEDRLFVATTNGLVLVYDNIGTSRGAAGPSRTITPTDGTGKISVNLHGIAYDAGRDLLVLTDVGAASGEGSASDGQLFTIARASTATGGTAVRYRIAGGASNLGNPVDVALGANGDAYVAEKSNSAVLRFDAVVTETGFSNLAATASATVASAESVTIANQ